MDPLITDLPAKVVISTSNVYVAFLVSPVNAIVLFGNVFGMTSILPPFHVIPVTGAFVLFNVILYIYG